jgi:hypothetical protein
MAEPPASLVEPYTLATGQSIFPSFQLGIRRRKKLISLNLNLKFENFVIFLFLVSG